MATLFRSGLSVPCLYGAASNVLLEMNRICRRWRPSPDCRIRVDRIFRQILKAFEPFQVYTFPSSVTWERDGSSRRRPHSETRLVRCRHAWKYFFSVPFVLISASVFLVTLVRFASSRAFSALDLLSTSVLDLAHHPESSTVVTPFIPLDSASDANRLIIPGISLVSACMNQHGLLASTINSWLTVAGVDEIILVDWSSSPPLDTVILENADDRLRIIRVSDEKHWSPARAYNLATGLSSFSIVALVACAHKLDSNFVRIHPLHIFEQRNDRQEKQFWHEELRLVEAGEFAIYTMSIIVPRNLFRDIGGYDERFDFGNAGVDYDLIFRLKQTGAEPREMNKSCLSVEAELPPAYFGHVDFEKRVVFMSKAELNLAIVKRILPRWHGTSSALGANITVGLDNSRQDGVVSIDKTSYTMEPKMLSIISSKNHNNRRTTLLRVASSSRSLSELTDQAVLRYEWRRVLVRQLHEKHAIYWAFLTSMETSELERLLHVLARMQSQSLRRLITVQASLTHSSLRIRQSSLATPGIFVVHVMHGLGNRLRALASAMAFASTTDRLLIVIWERDEHCRAFFHELFELNLRGRADKLFVINKFHVEWPQFSYSMKLDAGLRDWDLYNYMKMEGEGAVKDQPVQDTSGRHIYFKSAYIIVPSVGSASGWDLANKHLLHLVPVAPVRNLISLHQQQFDSSRTIGVHVRNMSLREEVEINATREYGVDELEVLSYWRNISKANSFYREMKILASQEPKARFFIASDSLGVVEEASSMFLGRVASLKKHPCDSREKECLQIALADIILLSRCEQFLGSPWSSFTEAVIRFGAKSVRIAGIDFARETGDDRTQRSPAVAAMLKRVAQKKRQRLARRNLKWPQY